MAYKQEQEVALWDPNSNPESTSDPFKTLFVSRINFYTSESKLRREFEQYGPIKSIKVINDKISEKPRGYCFIEFEQEKDMHCKYETFLIFGIFTYGGLFLCCKSLTNLITVDQYRRGDKKTKKWLLFWQNNHCFFW